MQWYKAVSHKKWDNTIKKRFLFFVAIETENKIEEMGENFH